MASSEAPAATLEAGASARPGRRRWLRLVPLALVLAAVVAAVASGATRWLSLDALQRESHTLVAFSAAHPYQCALAYMGLYALVVGISLPGALVMTLSGGFLFGPVWGSAAAVAGASTGAVAMFLVARTSLGDTLRHKAERSRGLLHKLEKAISDNAFSALLAMRLMPALPFGLVNIAAGCVRMPLWVYVSATVLGIIPSTAIYAGIGAGLGHVLLAGGKPDLHTVAEPRVMLPLVGLALLSTAPLFWRLWRRRRGQARPGAGA